MLLRNILTLFFNEFLYIIEVSRGKGLGNKIVIDQGR